MPTVHCLDCGASYPLGAQHTCRAGASTPPARPEPLGRMRLRVEKMKERTEALKAILAVVKGTP